MNLGTGPIRSTLQLLTTLAKSKFPFNERRHRDKVKQADGSVAALDVPAKMGRSSADGAYEALHHAHAIMFSVLAPFACSRMRSKYRRRATSGAAEAMTPNRHSSHTRTISSVVATCVVAFALMMGDGGRQLRAAGAQSRSDLTGSSASAEAVLNRYCVSCHNTRLQTAGLALDTMTVERVGDDADAWEKVVRKLRTATMPPAGRPRPDTATYREVATSLETALDRVAAAKPNPGRTTLHRLNRREYANAVRDLLRLEVDATELLPPENADLGFDNMADVLSVSPALLERYIVAARKISGLAVGDPSIEPTTATYVVPKMRFQDHRMSEDLPFGSRGGLAIRHDFPLDGQYDITIRLRRQLYDYVRGLQNRQQLEVRLDGRRVAVFTVGGAPGTAPPQTFAGAVLGDQAWEEYTLHADDELHVRVTAQAGPRVLGVSFVQARSERDGVLQPRATGKVLAIAER